MSSSLKTTASNHFQEIHQKGPIKDLNPPTHGPYAHLPNHLHGPAQAGPGAWGPGGNGGGPRRLLIALHMLREAELLTPAMFASLAVQWLPLVTQRVARKVQMGRRGEGIHVDLAEIVVEHSFT